MRLYPTLQLHKGRCALLPGGDLANPQIHDDDPLELAESFASAGAEWMHVTDLDGAAGEGDNAELIEEIIRVAGIPVQLGGGIRSRESVDYWLERGVGRVVLGSWPVWEPQMVRDLVKFLPDQIVLAVDVREGQVMINGWRQQSAFPPDQFISSFDDLPLAGILVTDIDSDVGEIDATLGLISGLAAGARAPVIASGVVRHIDDVARLAHDPNIAGAIIGRALLQGTVDLRLALSVAQPSAEPTAALQ